MRRSRGFGVGAVGGASYEQQPTTTAGRATNKHITPDERSSLFVVLRFELIDSPSKRGCILHVSWNVVHSLINCSSFNDDRCHGNGRRILVAALVASVTLCTCYEAL